MATYKQHTGDKGEDYACDLLVEKNFKIIKRNYRYGHGEIDVVAQDGDVLVFVEVKTRKNLEFGYPISGVTKAKQRQIRKIAEAYLIEHDVTDTDCRFDVVGVLLQGNERPVIDHIENAF
ncbi:MAG: YraN family protein [Chlorobi bacterium]|nr:YraN family protein [Chlorobiota bacterium]